jgi:hypothetical protein
MCNAAPARGAGLAPKAQFTTSLGQRPRIDGTKKTPALKARFTCATSLIIIRATRGIEARFQRLFLWESGFLGRCPRLIMKSRLLALNRCATETQRAYESPPLMPAQPKNAE